MKKIYAVRGAICSENTQSAIGNAVEELCKKIFSENKIQAKNIVSIQFTVTNDITAMNPAAALRKGNCGIDISQTALFCSSEPPVDGALAHTIRVMVTVYLPKKTTIRHIYLGSAGALRPDFSGG
ncbi:MAG: chorismate mutase [Treponema sp.]|jgi:chorismate mutase|nr:chorismate mutase [Treponema sp.]